jgi:hypothetical protein
VPLLLQALSPDILTDLATIWKVSDWVGSSVWVRVRCFSRTFGQSFLIKRPSQNIFLLDRQFTSLIRSSPVLRSRIKTVIQMESLTIRSEVKRSDSACSCYRVAHSSVSSASPWLPTARWRKG